LYARVELFIGVSALAVPIELAWGRELLLKNFPGMSLSTFYFPCASWIAITLVPWRACMGATFPFMMAAIKQEGGAKASPYFLGSCVLTLGSVAVAFSSKAYEQQFSPREVRRDSTATVIARGSTIEDKRLLINGVGMTVLSSDAKMMVHLPSAFLPRPPQKTMAICFGMGTTHLSMLSWGIPSPTVELVPSVSRLVSFFHANAASHMSSPLSHVVVDDSRFFLERSSDSCLRCGFEPALLEGARESTFLPA
jgi:hypothetical protein